MAVNRRSLARTESRIKDSHLIVFQQNVMVIRRCAHRIERMHDRGRRSSFDIHMVAQRLNQGDPGSGFGLNEVPGCTSCAVSVPHSGPRVEPEDA